MNTTRASNRLGENDLIMCSCSSHRILFKLLGKQLSVRGARQISGYHCQRLETMACGPVTSRIAFRGEDRAARNGTGRSFTDRVSTRTGFHFWLDS